MIDLFIDKQLVVLPESFTISIIEENSLFSINGTYTYDITLSLLDPINAKVYNHLNRINKKNGLPKNRSAYLVVDNEVVLNGTEVILDYSESQVKIQLVSGNSELNFLIGGDKKLRDLDLGKAEIDPNTIKDDLDHPYPERNWLILPFVARNLDDYYYGDAQHFVFNRWIFDYEKSPPSLRYQFDGTVPIVSNPSSELAYYKNYRPQPYLCFILDAILSSLGYKLIFNSLSEHPVLKYLYIVHGFDTLDFAKMLPDWTVKDFFEKIKEQYDCTFIIDPFTKEAGLYFNSKDLIEESISVETLDEFTLEVKEEEKRSIQSANIGYNMDPSEDDYYLYQKLDKSVISAVKQDSYNSYPNLLSKIKNENDKYRLRKIFSETDSLENVLIAGSRFAAFSSNANIVPQKVDSFRNLIQDPEREDIDITLDILPAPMQVVKGFPSQFYAQYPVVFDADPIVKEAEDIEEDFTPIQDLIEGDTSVESATVSSKMYLAIYSGRQSLISFFSKTDKAEKFPIPYVESLAEYFQNNDTIYYNNDPNANPFRLEWLKAEIYDKSSNIDRTRVYKLSFPESRKIKLRSKFIIKNKAFRCVKTERTVTYKGFDPVVKGEFYAYDE